MAKFRGSNTDFSTYEVCDLISGLHIPHLKMKLPKNYFSHKYYEYLPQSDLIYAKCSHECLVIGIIYVFAIPNCFVRLWY